MAITGQEVLNKIVEDRIADLRLTSARFVANLADKGRAQTKQNTNIDWVVDAGGAAVHWEPVTQDGTEDATDNTHPANLRIGRYRLKHQFPVSRVAIAEAAERAPGDLEDLFESHVRSGILSIGRELNRALYLADGSAAYGEVFGLNKIQDDSHSYAGINPNTVPAWKALNFRHPTTPGTARPLTKELLLDLDRVVAEAETYYDFIITNPLAAMKYNLLFDSLTGAGSQSIADNGRFRNVDLGYGGRFYNGTPIVEDPMCPAGTMYFLNSSDFTLYSFLLADNPTPKARPEQKKTVFGMNLNIAELPSNNSAVRRFELYVMPQMRVFNRKSVIALRDLA